MSNLFEDYREISNVRDKLDFLVELVQSAPRRVFLTRQGQVQAILIGPGDYTDLWNLEFDRDMAVGDEEEARGELVSNAEVFRRMDDLAKELESRPK
jgi:hypothetical protein